ncbi:MAG: hypothetical protein NXI31_13975 [bacterium]|nr:hypothetical protein [bacterium]
MVLATIVTTSCGDDSQKRTVDVPGAPGMSKSSAAVRADRRTYDGAPPIIPHQDFGADCLSCHERGMAVPDVGYAPPVPHEGVQKPGAMSRCRMCHVHTSDAGEFKANSFVGLAQDLRKGDRAHENAPPVIPHQILLRENCAACHTGPAAREEIRCSHPERDRCRQCHVEQRASNAFQR